MIKTIGIIGLGAIGGLVGAQLHQYDSENIYVLGDKERIQRYEKQGWINVNGMDYIFKGLTPGEKKPLDLIILSVKYHHLQSAIKLMKDFVGENTTIISLMNGITTEDELAAVYGRDKLLYSFIVGLSAVKEGRNVDAAAGTIVFNTYDNNEDRVIALRELFNKANITYETPHNILKELWWKFMINVGVNQLQAILDADYGVCQRVKEVRDLLDEIMKEVILLSQYEDVNLDQSDLERWYPILDELNPKGMTSMLQDVRAKRKTEVEMFAGVILEKAKKHGIKTPINNIILKLIQAKEAMWE